MSPIRSFAIAISFLLLSYIGLAQQLKLGKNPYTVQKSAILELQSDNQGLLLTRIADTASINLMSPPDGMMIYFTPTKNLLIRTNGHWQPILTTVDTSSIPNFYFKTRSLFSATAPIIYNNATGQIGITQATASANGYLSSADWNTFNNKAGSFVTGNLTETGSGILTIAGGTNAVIGSGTSIQVKQANTSQNGFLSSTDWNTFNGKLSTIDTTNISNFYLKVRKNLSAGTGIGYSITSGVISNTGVLSVNGNTGTLTMDTSYISNFYLKTRSLFSNTAPITYNNATGAIGITQASTSTNGYLSSADWNTFNNKASAFTTGNLTETGSGILTITGGTGAVAGSGTAIQVKQASTSQNGFLSSTDWNTFNNKLSTVDTSNISNFYLKVRGLHTAGPGIGYSNTTGVISNTGVLSLNGNTGALTVDTGYISNFSVKTRSLFSSTAPITYSNGLIGITQASTSTNGYLSSADWNTFNNKAASFTTGNLTETGSGILTITGGTGAVAGSGTSIQVKQASTSQNGFLSSTDWNIFNNKLSTVDTSNISNFYLKVRGLHTAGPGIGYSNTTGVISNTGVLSLNGNTGALTMDTGYISNFSVKARGLFSGTAPVTFNNATGAIGITQASTSTNGYLSSSDWNTFNNKAASFTTGNLTETGSGILSITGGTGAVAGSGTSIQVKQASTSQNGFLSSTDWNIFNNKLSTVDTTNISNFYLKVRGLHTAGAGIGYSNTTGVISNTGVLSLNGNTGALTMDTGYINNFSVKTRSLFSSTAPITYANGLIGITQASTSTNGYLSSADWNTFNNKAASFTTGNLTETGSGILTITGGTGAVAGSGTAIQVKQASTSQNGFLSSTDWNTFNSKLSTIDTGNISNFYLKVRGLHTAGPGIGYSNTTGVISNTGVLSLNGNTGALTMDTGYISNFSVKIRSLFSSTAPITYSNGLIGITQASTSTNGYLSSADWNTFNNKAASFTTGNLTETGSGILTITGGTGAIAGSGTAIQVKQASTSQNGFLSSTDWNTFNSKLSTVDTGNISNFYLKVRGLHTAGPGIGYSNTTGVISNTGVLSLNGNTGALTMDTGYISNFSVKTRSLFSAGAGITYNAATGLISSSVQVLQIYGHIGGNTVGAIKTIGTIDNYDFPFITNNTERMRLK